MGTKVILRQDVAKARLQTLGLTQLALAVLCELDLRTVQRWLSGRPVRIAEADRLARALRIGTGDLFANVPEHAHGRVMELFALMSRLPVLRDHPSAPMVRAIPRSYAEFMTPISFRQHPLHGYVHPFPMSAFKRHTFAVFRLHTRVRRAKVQVLLRLAPSMLVERAVLLLRDDDAWVVENHMVRSMRSPRRPDGSCDLWCWIGHEASELLFVADSDAELTPEPNASAEPALFDMTSDSTQHAVCVRPTITQLAAADLPRAFDRLVHRDTTRVDVPEPREA